MEQHPYLSSRSLQLIILFSVALATPLTVMLLSQQQDIRQRAAEPEAAPTPMQSEHTPTASFETDLSPTPTVYCTNDSCL